MDAPTSEHGPHAHVPPVREERDWPPANREAAIERAREARLEDDLPVDQATLERIADAVMSPHYPVPGLFQTDEEMRDEVPRAVQEAVHEYVRARPEIDGGRRHGWRDGRRVLFVGVVGDPRPHEQALASDRVVIESVPRTLGELDAVMDRLTADDEELAAAGFEFLCLTPHPLRGVVEVELVGRDADAARAYFAERYGDTVEVEWCGSSRLQETPHPFGSWTSEGRTLRVFYGLDLNGQQPGPIRVAEEDAERVVVALTCFSPVGPVTLIGGHTDHHADVELRAPVGNRRVIDASAGTARPSLAELRRR